MTVVFDDPDLYRQVKIRAAEEGVPAKAVVERALKELFDRERRLRNDISAMLGGTQAKPIDWEAWGEWQAEVERLDRKLGPGPTDLSNVKKYLYGEDSKYADRSGFAQVAEERAEFDPR
jgi:hypothetical protein